MVWLELSDVERKAALALAEKRQSEALRLGMKDRYGAKPEDALHYHCIGALGEFGVAKFLNWPAPTSCNVGKAPDLPGHIQVRTRKSTSAHLVVRKDDDKDDWYVLAVAQNPYVIIVGGMLGWNAVRTEYLYTPRDRPEAYYVPASALLDADFVRTFFARRVA